MPEHPDTPERLETIERALTEVGLAGRGAPRGSASRGGSAGVDPQCPPCGEDQGTVDGWRRCDRRYLGAGITAAHRDRPICVQLHLKRQLLRPRPARSKPTSRIASTTGGQISGAASSRPRDSGHVENPARARRRTRTRAPAPTRPSTGRGCIRGGARARGFLGFGPGGGYPRPKPLIRPDPREARGG